MEIDFETLSGRVFTLTGRIQKSERELHRGGTEFVGRLVAGLVLGTGFAEPQRF